MDGIREDLMVKENIDRGLVKIKWPDDHFVEEGYVSDENKDMNEVLFHSKYDQTINWVPKNYIVKDKKKNK